MKLSAKWLNKFHINVIVVFPENIHTPSTEGNGNLIECGGGGGGGVQKATTSEGWSGSRSFQGAAAATDSYFIVRRCFKTIILRYCGWAFWAEIF